MIWTWIARGYFLSMGRFVIGLLIGALLLVGYGVLIEPFWLQVTRHKVIAPTQPLRVAHLTDLHFPISRSLQDQVLETVRSESPDLIVITGDSVSDPRGLPELRVFLESCDAPLGVWMVDGNWDHWSLPAPGLRSLAGDSALLLRNKNKRVREDLWIVGVDDAIAGQPEIEPAFSGLPSGVACIALFHSPEFFSKVRGKCFLNLAGHTHGGQVKLPWFGPLWLPPGSGAYVAGWYGDEASRLYVSRGIGTSLIRMRIFARPEIAIFEVGSK